MGGDTASRGDVYAVCTRFGAPSSPSELEKLRRSEWGSAEHVKGLAFPSRAHQVGVHMKSVQCLAVCVLFASGAASAQTVPPPSATTVAPAQVGVFVPKVPIAPPTALQARYTQFRALPSVDVGRVRVAKVALYKRLRAMAITAQSDLLAVSRQETQAAFGATHTAAEIEVFAGFILMELANAVEEDGKELSDAYAVLAKERAALAAIVAKQPLRTPTALEVANELAKSLVLKTKNLEVEYRVSPKGAALGTVPSPEQVQLAATQSRMQAVQSSVEAMTQRSRELYELTKQIMQNWPKG